MSADYDVVNREATGMKSIPQRLLVLGGGPVGVEMAQASPAAGRRAYEVRVLEPGESFEPAAVLAG
jgi:pyruvate/2-oxoglutarate dehydrogenase complex dihydrolipoamide dehydrogenase (E3) component